MTDQNVVTLQTSDEVPPDLEALKGRDDVAVMVFTFKGMDTILGDRGIQSFPVSHWRASNTKYCVCVRNRHTHTAEDDTPHSTAFVIGRIRDVVPTTEPDQIEIEKTAGDTHRWRYQILFSEYALIDVPDVWANFGGRGSVYYHSLDTLGIDPAALDWIPMPTDQPSAGQKESSLGQTMREHRIAKGWTSKRLADEMGISVGHCVKLERGERRWSVEMIDAAAKAFGITRSEMWGQSDHPLPSASAATPATEPFPLAESNRQVIERAKAMVAEHFGTSPALVSIDVRYA